MLQIPSLIDSQQMEIISAALAEARFIDGKLSAGNHAKKVKSNKELDQSTETAIQLSKIIIGNLYNSATFRSAALPLHTATPFFAKYGTGMAYGDHIDDPVMGEGQRFRCDVATTIFLNNPDEYEGGELVIRTSFGDQEAKLAKGDAIIYPASSLHHVNEVTKGERIVAVTWTQSMVRNASKRELLHELNQAREKLMLTSPDTEETAQVDHSYTNLVRMWSEI